MLYPIPQSYQLPVGTRYRVIADRGYVNGTNIIQTEQPIDGLVETDETFDLADCIIPWQIVEAPELPDLKQTVANMNINAFNRPVETVRELLEQSTIDNAVNLYNSDGVKRVEKVGE